MANKRITDVDLIDSLNGDESFFVNRNSSLRQINKEDVVWGIANGGTGATDVASARNVLGLGNTSGALPIANGGTGQTTVAAARNALGLGNTSGAVPIANGGTGATTAAAARTNLGAQATHIKATATLSSSGWSSSAQTVTVSGVTSSNTVIVSPQPAYNTTYVESGIYCSAQGTNTLTFKYTYAPSSNIGINVVILN